MAAEAQARAGEPGRRAGKAGRSARQETPRPVGAQAAGASGQPRGSGHIVSGFPALFSRLRLPRLRLPLPSPASRAPRDADFGWAPEEPWSFLSSVREPLPLRALSLLLLLLLHFSVPDAAAASCHRPSSQHGGGGGGNCRSASRGHGKSTTPPPHSRRPRLPSPPPPPRTPHASLRRPPSSITGSVVYAVGGRCGRSGPPNASSPDSEATPLLATVARRGKLALAKLLQGS